MRAKLSFEGGAVLYVAVATPLSLLAELLPEIRGASLSINSKLAASGSATL